jgi:hypothetical protein
MIFILSKAGLLYHAYYLITIKIGHQTKRIDKKNNVTYYILQTYVIRLGSLCLLDIVNLQTSIQTNFALLT